MSVWGDAESSIARVREQMAETLERAERAQGLKDQIAAVRGTSTSPKGEVTVEVDASGRLVDITFSADAARLSPEELLGRCWRRWLVPSVLRGIRRLR